MGYIFRGYFKWDIGRNDLPGDKYLNKFTEADKPVGQVPKTHDQGKNDHYLMT